MFCRRTGDEDPLAPVLQPEQAAPEGALEARDIVVHLRLRLAGLGLIARSLRLLNRGLHALYLGLEALEQRCRGNQRVATQGVGVLGGQKRNGSLFVDLSQAEARQGRKKSTGEDSKGRRVG